MNQIQVLEYKGYRAILKLNHSDNRVWRKNLHTLKFHNSNR